MSRFEAALLRCSSPEHVPVFLPERRIVPVDKPSPPENDTRPAASPESGGDELSGLTWARIAGRGDVDSAVCAPDPPVATEQYRKLAGVLLRERAARGTKVVMIASALPSEGKSQTVGALAFSLSSSYRQNVLVIDADLRLPLMHEVFGVTNVPGLSDLLEARPGPPVAPVEVLPHLTLLTGGRPTNDPVGGLTSPRMRRLVAEASARFDWVIIDTPPVSLLPDANLLTAMVDTVVLVVAAGHAPHQLLTGAIATLGSDRILGAVLNRAETGIHLKGYAYSRRYDYAKA